MTDVPDTTPTGPDEGPAEGTPEYQAIMNRRGFLRKVLVGGAALVAGKWAIQEAVPSIPLAIQLLSKGYQYDPATGNFLAPERVKLVPEKIWNQPIMTRNIGGRTVKLRQDAMERLLRADEKFSKAHPGRHILVNESLRSNLTQAGYYGRNVEGKAKGNQKTTGHVGMSTHEFGLAIDVHDPGGAEDYLFAEGFKGGSKMMSEKQGVHFAIYLGHEESWEGSIRKGWRDLTRWFD